MNEEDEIRSRANALIDEYEIREREFLDKANWLADLGQHHLAGINLDLSNQNARLWEYFMDYRYLSVAKGTRVYPII